MLTKEELQTRLSTLLKASEGMEKALEKISCLMGMWVNDSFNLKTAVETAKQALADFRAVKDGEKCEEPETCDCCGKRYSKPKCKYCGYVNP